MRGVVTKEVHDLFVKTFKREPFNGEIKLFTHIISLLLDNRPINWERLSFEEHGFINYYLANKLISLTEHGKINITKPFYNKITKILYVCYVDINK